MLRTVGPSGSLFELLLPAGMRVLSGELARIDVLLDDPGLFEPFRPFFDVSEGRPSIPIPTYLRMMFLKYHYQVGYERLCTMITDSLSWRRFCRIGLETAVPDESTIRKITVRCGPDLIDGLNARVLATADAAGKVDLTRTRVDSTVVEADIKYPTDSGLLTAAVGRIAVALKRLAAQGVTVSSVDRTLEARGHQHSIGVWLRRRSDEAKAEVLAITGKLADLAELSVSEARKAQSHTGLSRKTRRMIERLTILLDRTDQVIVQARCRTAGGQPDGATRLVSLHEPDARPIRKGQLGKPVQFGYKAQVVDNVDGLIIDHSVHTGNPSDTTLLRPAIERIRQRFSQPPGLLTADRGYWDTTIEGDLRAADIAGVAIPRTGKASLARQEIERADSFVEAIKWRTGSEGRISHLKRDCGWRRTRLRGHSGARVWCGYGVLAHNLVKLDQLKQ